MRFWIIMGAGIISVSIPNHTVLDGTLSYSIAWTAIFGLVCDMYELTRR